MTISTRASKWYVTTKNSRVVSYRKTIFVTEACNIVNPFIQTDFRVRKVNNQKILAKQQLQHRLESAYFKLVRHWFGRNFAKLGLIRYLPYTSREKRDTRNNFHNN